MKILQLVTKRQYRGAEVFAAQLSTELVKKGHQVLYAGLYKPSKDCLNAENAINIDLNARRSKFNFFLVRRLLNLIRKYKPEIIQANGSDTLKYAAICKLFFPHVKIVYRNISMVSSWTGKNYLKRIFNQMLFKNVDMVTSVGVKAMNDLINTYHFPLNKATVIRRGITYKFYDPILSRKRIADEFGFSANCKMLIHIGEFSEEKNHFFLVNCFERILLRTPDAILIFIGTGNKFKSVVDYVRNKKLDRQIFFTGHKTNTQEYLAGSDAMILGSKIEGVPGVILEAAMQSVPAVAVNVGGIAEAVINFKTGLLIESHDEEKFSTSVSFLLADETLRKFLGQNAREYVKENYSIENCGKAYELLFNKLIRA